MFKRLVTSALVFGAVCTAPPALAQSAPCAPRAAIVAGLVEKYNEELAAQGLRSPTTIIEVFASRDTRTFTVLISRIDGLSCVIATGDGWSGLFPTVDPRDPLG